ncbi:MAG: RNA 2',3'-cyclic phosphodiesterase [Candidatus Angelobacter sp. Gp1-AA117]|nr:MAG: RNA 2',3'-cyclic phosphodiesterase [Candidatus Angelobacter sp. Gp1-AA117]
MRIFVALDIPEEIRTRLGEYIERVRHLAPDAPWVKPESLHVTLKFIGEAKDARVEEVKNVLKQIKAQPFDVTFPDVGFFPNHNSGRVFWAGVDGGEALPELAGSIDQALEKIGIEAEKRAYHPHLTLARAGTRSGAYQVFKQLPRGIDPEEHPQFGTMTAREFFLYKSELLRGGARYTKLERFPLGE